ncbi:MAG TPA: threonine/serine exporter family protein [Holophaga sp.]|nr:threonine/serine exporter family protein [Holophaga sp.]
MTPASVSSPSGRVLSSHPEVDFVLALGRALQTYGASASTLEQALGSVGEKLGLEGALYATPTGFLASLRKEGHHGKTYLQRIETGMSDLDKLTQVEALVDLVVEERLDVHQAKSHLAGILAGPPRYGPWQVAGAYGLASFGMARVLGGGWREMLLGTFVGLLVGALILSLQRRRSMAELSPLAGGLVSALGSALLASLLPGSSQTILALTGIIVLIPGLNLLVSMQELGTGHLVSGTARMAGTILVFLLLGFGMGLGQRLAGGLAHHTDPLPLPLWTLFPALVVVVLSFMVVFQSRLGNLGWTLVASALGWLTSAAGTLALGPEAGAGLGALVLGAACNLYGRQARRPAMVLLLPSIMLLLPGSIGFRSLTLLLHQQTLAGLEAGFHALFVSAALMLGLLVANATVPRRSF